MPWKPERRLATCVLASSPVGDFLARSRSLDCLGPEAVTDFYLLMPVGSGKFQCPGPVRNL